MQGSHDKNGRTRQNFRPTLLRYVRLMAWAVRLLSVCRLSVTFVRPAQVVSFFVNIPHHLIADGLGQFVLKFWKEIWSGSR